MFDGAVNDVMERSYTIASVNSSAPISGVVKLLTSPSKSLGTVMTAAKLLPWLVNVFACKSVVEMYVLAGVKLPVGLLACELTTSGVPDVACHDAKLMAVPVEEVPLSIKLAAVVPVPTKILLLEVNVPLPND